MSFNMTMDENGRGTLTVFEDDEVFTINSEDPNFGTYVAGLANGRSFTEMKEEANPYEIVEQTGLLTLGRSKDSGTERLFFDGEPIEPILEQTIIRYRRQGRSTHNLVSFLERLHQNTSESSKEFLYQWATTSGMTITEDGYLLGWRGLNSEGKSIHQGEAYVDGVLHTGNIPNPVGSVISMNREDCESDPSVSCGAGLHVGSESYATNWAQGSIVYVKVDPKDVVSVPNHECEKMRVSRFEVIDLVTQDVVDFEPEAHEIDDEEIISDVSDFIEEQIEDSGTASKWVSKIKNLYSKHS